MEKIKLVKTKETIKRIYIVQKLIIYKPVAEFGKVSFKVFDAMCQMSACCCLNLFLFCPKYQLYIEKKEFEKFGNLTKNSDRVFEK